MQTHLNTSNHLQTYLKLSGCDTVSLHDTDTSVPRLIHVSEFLIRLLGSQLGRLLGSQLGRLLGSQLGRLLGSQLGRLLGSQLGRLNA